MKINFLIWEFIGFLKIAILHAVLIQIVCGSVLPRPNIRQRSTTQTANVERNYSEGRAIVIVTSSELPKQIPPPPTPTKPHEPTPKYDFTPSTTGTIHKNQLHRKDMFATFHVPYLINNANAFHDFT